MLRRIKSQTRYSAPHGKGGSLRLYGFLLLSLAIAAQSKATVLDTLCLSNGVGTILTILQKLPGSVQMAESLGYNLDSMQVRGTCDSITLVYPVKIVNQTIYLPIATAKKMNSCSLSVSGLMGAGDTVINMCVLPGSVIHAAAERALPTATGAIRMSKSGSAMVLAWNATNTPVRRISLIGINGTLMYAADIPQHAGSMRLPKQSVGSVCVVAADLADGRRITFWICLVDK